jgi:hypothetical protein
MKEPIKEISNTNWKDDAISFLFFIVIVIGAQLIAR